MLLHIKLYSGWVIVKYIYADKIYKARAAGCRRKWEKFGEGIYYKSKITLLVENLIQTLNGYKEIEIL